ncbi:hypothetical protein [Methylibium sp.]|uniref:hypothetical protein n=2 Tax=Methylibium sp. TaxID=2067992 RepID=UPI00333F379D
MLMNMPILRPLFGAALCTALGLALLPTAQAKLPAPTPEAKAKADEAKAKTAWSDKVAAYQLCKSMDRVAARYAQDAKAIGKDARPATATPACTDPGPYQAAAAAPAPPLEAAGAHSPAKTATSPPSGKATSAEQTGTPKK